MGFVMGDMWYQIPDLDVIQKGSSRLSVRMVLIHKKFKRIVDYSTKFNRPAVGAWRCQAHKLMIEGMRSMKRDFRRVAEDHFCPKQVYNSLSGNFKI